MIEAAKLVVWYEEVPPEVGPGDRCYLDDYCYGQPVCQSRENYAYATAQFNVPYPPPPPPSCATPTNFRLHSVSNQTDGSLVFLYLWSSSTGRGS
jgi:hypothetical protein